MNYFVKFDHHKLQLSIRSTSGDHMLITKNDLEISYFSGGPGGQNVNRNLNGVRLIYRIPKNAQLPNKKTTTIVSKSMRQRKRDQNFIVAFEGLAKKLARYYYRPIKRKNTNVPRSSKEKRLTNKKIRSQKKQSRKKPVY